MYMYMSGHVDNDTNVIGIVCGAVNISFLVYVVSIFCRHSDCIAIQQRSYGIALILLSCLDI